MLVYTNGFWGGFTEKTDGVHFGVFELILKYVFQTDIQRTDNIDDADILLESNFSDKYLLSVKPWKYSIYFTGEGSDSWPLPADIDKYTFNMGSKKTKNNFISCPLYILYDYCTPSTYPTDITKVPRRPVCCTFSSPVPEMYRYTLLEILQSNNIPIDCAGRYRNTTGYTIPGNYYERSIIDYESHYRLVLAFENTELEDYITEKIINPFRAGTIPVYYGSEKIGDYFNLNRFVIINKENIQESIHEIRRLLVDDTYWLEKVNQPIFKKTTEQWLNDIIISMRNILRKMIYNVEVICNISKEQERLETLQPILNYYNIEPSCTVWGEDAKTHEFFNKFRSCIKINAISIAINQITLLQKYANSDKYLLILESDVIPKYDLQLIDKEIQNTVQEMKDNNIDFTFLGEGCFGSVNIFSPPTPLTQITQTLFITQSSRCLESYIVSPNGINKLLKFFFENNEHVVMDFIYNYLFKDKTIISCWKIPELFTQGSLTGKYKSLIPLSDFTYDN